MQAATLLARDPGILEIPSWRPAIPSVQIRMPAEGTKTVSQNLWRIFTSCGFDCEIVRSMSAPSRGVLIEVNPNSQSECDLLCAAFDHSGIKTRLVHNPALPFNSAIIHIGRTDAF